jgi:nucleoside-diphosphate-sugar epimerase
MKILATGGAGFIGRWVVKRLLSEGHQVWILDNLDNGRELNLEEFRGNPLLKEFVKGDVVSQDTVSRLFEERFDLCFHMAAQINVHESLKNPQKAYNVNVLGTYNILEAARKHGVKIILLGTCMVYDLVNSSSSISETHPVKPASPYAGSKLAAENLAESYFHGFGLPVVICRPFNTYGPFQKSNMEGGVVSIFIERALKGEDLLIFGDGTQTRDLLYAEDCADFLYKAATTPGMEGEILNAGLGTDIPIKDLALKVCGDKRKIKFVSHHHPQSEIQKLICDFSKARERLGWRPSINLDMGIELTRKWIVENQKKIQPLNFHRKDAEAAKEIRRV